MGAGQSQPAVPVEQPVHTNNVAATVIKHKLTEGDLDALGSFISSAHLRWRDIGRSLGFKHTELSGIVPKQGLTTQNDYFMEMLSCYLKWAPPGKQYPATEDIIKALRDVGEHNLALKLQEDVANFMANKRLI